MCAHVEGAFVRSRYVKLQKILGIRRRKRRILDQVDGFTTIIGAQSVVAGTFGGNDNYYVQGRVTGQCDLAGTICLAESGQWIGDVAADNVIIAGHVEGNVTAYVRLELAATARIRGNLRSPAIAIAQGAIYDGEISMDRDTHLTHFRERRVEPESS